MVLEKTPESPLDCKELQPVQTKGDQSWVFTGRPDVEAETPDFGHLMRRVDSLGKNADAGRDWGPEEKGTTEDEMAGITDSMDMSLGELRELVMERKTWRVAIHGVTKIRTRLSN